MTTVKYRKIGKVMIWVNVIMAAVYISWWMNPAHIGNVWLYGLLFGSEIYHLIMALTFWQTTYPYKEEKSVKDNSINTKVDVMITVCGEPVEVVRKTALAAKALDYPNFEVHILNDGRVAKKDNWREIMWMAEEVGVNCITRTVPGGAKAGNVNNGLKKTNGEFVTVLDADMVPNKNFLKELVPYFGDKKLGFIQSPQYYQNHGVNEITKGSWEQQELFFGAIMKGKSRNNAAFICGTNFVARRTALEEAGGFDEKNIAEDFLTSIYIHKNGWRSKYVNKVMTKGLAPEDAMAYYKQQLRWARGSLEAFFTHNPIFIKGLDWRQKIQYLSSMLFYFNGLVVLIDIIMPLLYLWWRLEPVVATSTSFALFFLPFMGVNLFTLNRASGGRITFRAMGFTQSSFTIHMRALVSIILGQQMGFVVTPKQRQEGNFLSLAYPHMIYIALTIGGSIYGIIDRGMSSSMATNIAWALLNCVMFLPFINSCYRWGNIPDYMFGRIKEAEPQAAFEVKK